MIVTVRNVLYLLVGLGIMTANASAVTDFNQKQNGDYVGRLDPVQEFDIISLPIDGAVRASDIEGCEFKGQPKAYGYNGVGYTKALIHGERGNALRLENSCEFTIDQDDIIDDEPRDIDNNEWFVFSPTEERELRNLYATNGCTVNGLDGYPLYQVDTSGNQPMEDGVLEGEKSYWLRLQGQNCEVDFLESASDDNTQDGSDAVDEGSDTSEAGAVDPRDAFYRFYLANGDKSESFSAVNDLNTYDQDIEFLRKGTKQKYSLIFRVESYDTDGVNTVDVMEGTRLLVNTPKSRNTLQNQCERGLPYRCAAPRYPSEFQSGEYVVKVKDQEIAETFAEKKVTLPAFVQGGL